MHNWLLSEVWNIKSPNLSIFQQRKFPEFWITKWSEEETWFHSFAIPIGSRNLDQVYDVGDQGGHHVLWSPELWDKSRDLTHLNWRLFSIKRTPSIHYVPGGQTWAKKLPELLVWIFILTGCVICIWTTLGGCLEVSGWLKIKKFRLERRV